MNQNKKLMLQTANSIIQEIFGNSVTYDTLSKIKASFAFDIPLPQRFSCAFTQKPVYISHIDKPNDTSRIISQKAVVDKFHEDGWINQYQDISSILELFKLYNKINYIIGNRSIDSKDLYKSDNIFTSNYVYGSSYIFNSSYIFFSHNIYDSRYILASVNSNSLTYSIRVKGSQYVSNSFEVSWSSNISNSFFIHDSADLHECMFCSHIRSKEYCIANIQYSKEQYFRIKSLILKWIQSHNMKS